MIVEMDLASLLQLAETIWGNTRIGAGLASAYFYYRIYSLLLSEKIP